MKQTDAYLRGRFVSGYKPTQQDFSDLIDSKRSESKKITFNDLSNDLQEQINSIPGGQVILPDGATSWLAPAGTWLSAILFVDSSSISLMVGTDVGLDDIVASFEHSGGFSVINTSYYFAVDTAIFFGGIRSQTKIIIRK